MAHALSLALYMRRREEANSNGFCQDADAGIHCRRLHRRELVDVFPDSEFAEGKRPSAKVIEIFRLVPRAEQFIE